MGCDIHMYVEYTEKKEEEKWWLSFGGRFNPGRNYDLFAILADVRNYDGAKCIYPPRGLPEPLGFRATWDYYLRVNKSAKSVDECFEGQCLQSHADKWTATGQSVWRDDSKDVVSNPDWHTPSWLYVDELEEVLKKSKWSFGREYKALLAAMKSLKNDNYLVRVVFWFDN